jgi:hypothetical protein
VWPSPWNIVPTHTHCAIHVAIKLAAPPSICGNHYHAAFEYVQLLRCDIVTWRINDERQILESAVFEVEGCHCNSYSPSPLSSSVTRRRDALGGGTMAEWHMAVTPQEHKCQNCKSRVSQDSHCLGVKGAPKAGFSGETEG